MADWYERQGGVVIGRRVKTAGGEIDLVVRLGDMLIFVEVKARRTTAAALEGVRPKNIARLCQAAACYMAHETGPNIAFGASVSPDLRLDVAAVAGDGTISVVENASL